MNKLNLFKSYPNFVAILLISMAACPGKVSAAAYYVSPAGNDFNNNGLSLSEPFKTIQRAADLTQPGDVVNVMNGTYSNSTPEVSITIITRSGLPNKWITFRAYPGQKPKIKLQANYHGFAIEGARYIVVEGFEIEGNNDNITLAYAVSQKNNLSNPSTSGNGIGVYAFENKPNPPVYPHHIIIRKNKVYKCGGGGIYTSTADYVTIEDNIVYQNALYTPYGNSGISMYQNYNSDKKTTYKQFIRRNIIHDNKNLVPFFAAGAVTDGNGIIVDDSRQTQNGSKLTPYFGRTLIENNVAYDNGGRGIHVFESDHVDIVNNTTYQNSKHPAIKEGEISSIIAGDVRVFNNIMFATTGRPANTLYNSPNTRFDYNLTYNATSFSGPTLNNIIGVNPMFSSEGTKNFRLKFNSPAINAGSISLYAKQDFLRTLRPQRGGVDIGAYELK